MVKDAIILAGGMGTRMLPASLYMPKETMPLVDTPLLNHLVWEAARAGVARVHLVLSPEKRRVLSEFIGRERVHEETVRPDLPGDSLTLGIKGVEIIPHVQSSSLGVADAISVALEDISGPFLVILGDNLLISDHCGPEFSGKERASDASARMVSSFEKSGLPCVGICRVESSEVSKYGVVELRENTILQIVEKPSESEAPSNYIMCGRYLLPENSADILEKIPVSDFGELQSIQLLNHLILSGGLQAVKMDDMRMYDSGSPLAWLKSQVDHALRRDDIGGQFYEWIKKRILE